MSIVDTLKAWPKAKKITVAVIAAVAVAAVGVTIFLINRNNILATTMRLLKVEGTVNIEDASGTVAGPCRSPGKPGRGSRRQDHLRRLFAA